MYRFIPIGKMLFDPICIFLNIDFCENLQEYFFVQNQFLILKIIKKMNVPQEQLTYRPLHYQKIVYFNLQ